MLLLSEIHLTYSCIFLPYSKDFRLNFYLPFSVVHEMLIYILFFCVKVSAPCTCSEKGSIKTLDTNSRVQVYMHG
jgi:hypothetical protein